MENLIYDLKTDFSKIEENYRKEIERISDFIYQNPELSGEEFISSAFLADILENNNFIVTPNYCGYKTAFRGEFILGNSEGPVIAFLAEYDALPTLLDPSKTKPAHTCGHNWIAAATTGVAICLSKLRGLNGKIVLIGTPAEETFGSKVDMVREDAFRDIDIVLQPHLEAFTDINCTALALDAIEFKFYGKATHAASYPYKGINALDAVQLMFSGVNALRQQLREDVKVSGIVSSGGEASNIIPDYAACKYTIRASTREYLNEVTKKIVNCARGAELMTGAVMKYDFFENQTDDILNVDILQKILKKNMIEEGIENIRDDAIMPTGSSDIGNVSQVCPTMYFEIDIEADEEFYTHDIVALKYVNSKFAYKKLNQVVRIMGNTAIDLITSKNTVDTIKRRHLELRNINNIK